MADISKLGSFLPTTNLYDIYELNIENEGLKQFLIRLTENINSMLLSINNKDTGYYALTEFVNSQLFFPNPTLTSLTAQTSTYRQVYRKVVYGKILPNAATITIPHGLTPTNTWSFTRIYGAASDITALLYIPLPYSSPVLANNIEVSADATNVIITTGSNRTNFGLYYIVLEFIKQ